MSDNHCPGTCNRRYRRAETAYQTALGEMRAKLAQGQPAEVPEPHGVTADKGEPIWCTPCQGTLRAGLVRLPMLAAKVAIRIDGKLVAQMRAERVGTPGGSPSGSPAYDTFDEIVQWTCGWEDAARPLFGHEPAALPTWTPDRGRALDAAARYLTGWHQQILANPDVAYDFGHELAGVVRRAERTAGLDDSTTRLRAPCRRCDLVGYERSDGSEQVECRHCHDRMTMDHYETWSKLAAQAAAREAS